MPFEAKNARECYRRAAEAHNRAIDAEDPDARDFQLGLERSWIVLGSSYELSAKFDSVCVQQAAWLQAHH
jgi:hypothetical protein